MALTDPSVNPNVTTTQTSQTTAPDWYNAYTSGLASQGQAAIQQGGVAGASPLQSQAYSTAPTAIAAGQPTMGQAVQSATNVQNTPTYDLINRYFDPYVNDVVENIGKSGAENFYKFIDPSMTSAAVAGGQFGSSRAQTVQANAAKSAALGIAGQQAQARNTGWQKALEAAQNQQTLGLNTARTLGELSGQQYTQGVGGLDILSKLGAQQQAIEQAKLNYPMTSLQNYANLMSGITIPTGTTQSVTGPAGAGQLQDSILKQIATMGTSGMQIWNSAFGQAKNPDGTPKVDANGRPIMQTLGQSILDFFKNSGQSTGTPTVPDVSIPTDPTTGLPVVPPIQEFPYTIDTGAVNPPDTSQNTDPTAGLVDTLPYVGP